MLRRSHRLDDDALIAAAQRDPAAFSALYERYHQEIYLFVLKRVSHPEQAEDITSQVFLRALRALPDFERGSFRGWIYRIARNAIIDSYRRPSAYAPGDDFLGLPDPAPGPADIAEANEALEELQRILEQLTDTQRDVIQLRLAGHTGQEIADRLGLTLGSVKSAQFRAFERIRRLLPHAIPDRTTAPVVHEQVTHES